jgi:hypothetical protein
MTDVRGDRALGDDQAGRNLLVAEPLGNELRHLYFPFGEGSGLGAVRRNDLAILRFVKSEPHCRLAAQPFARVKFSSELRLPQSSGRRLFGFGQERGMRSTVVGASTGAHARCSPEQPGCASRLTRTRGMRAKTR